MIKYYVNFFNIIVMRNKYALKINKYISIYYIINYW